MDWNSEVPSSGVLGGVFQLLGALPSCLSISGVKIWGCCTRSRSEGCSLLLWVLSQKYCNPHQENGTPTANNFSSLDHEWSIYHLDPKSQGCISVSSEWCNLNRKLLGQMLEFPVGIQGEQRTEGTSHPAFRSDAAVSGTLRWCSVTVQVTHVLLSRYPMHCPIAVKIAYALSHRWWDVGVRPRWSMLLQFCDPSFKEVCISGFSDKIRLTKILVFYDTSA